MKIALVTNFLYPDGLGGTELYCYQLANALIEENNEVYWFVPNFDSSATVTDERGKGIRIVKFATFNSRQESSLDIMVGSFTREMKSRGIGVAHFNEFGADDGISAGLLAGTKKSGIAAVVTLHLGNYVCQTGTMHIGGIKPCDGKIIQTRCSSCHLFSNATSSFRLNHALTRLFDNVLKLRMVESLRVIKRLSAGINLKKSFISTIADHADVIVSLTKWFREVLIINNVPAGKITYIPQVSPEINIGSVEINHSERSGYLFVGRVNKEKGVDMLLKIAGRLRKILPSVVIDLYGPYTPTDVLPHTVISNLNSFDNIRYYGILNPDEVLGVMNRYKAVILPSRVAEMAPLIIMEANKLQLPVIASDVPGSVELINQYDCGLIFNYLSAEDLIKRIIEIESNVHKFTFIQPAENNFLDVAKKYIKIYRGCIDQINPLQEKE